MGDETMESRLNTLKHNGKERTLYNYYSAKKIYLTKTPAKYILVERKDSSLIKTISLTSRDTVVFDATV